MPSFLELPYEIRRLIVSYLYPTTRSSPDSISSEDHISRRLIPYTGVRRVGRRHAANHAKGIYHELDPKAYVPNVSALRAVNHQLYSETTEMIKFHPSIYCLDVLLNPHQSLWPTWTSIPAHRTRLDEMRVTFRRDSRYYSIHGGRSVYYTVTDDDLSSLFCDIVCRGPRAPQGSGTMSKDWSVPSLQSNPHQLTIGILDIDIRAETMTAIHHVWADVPHEPGARICSPCQIHQRKTLDTACRRSGRMVDRLSSFTRSILSEGKIVPDRGWVNKAQKMVMEGVGSIRIRVDGVMQCHTYLELVLQKLLAETTNHADTLLLQDCEKERRARGLPAQTLQEAQCIADLHPS